MKNILFMLLIFSCIRLFAAASPEYDFMKTTYQNAFEHQQWMEFWIEAINQKNATLNTKCKDIAPNTVCTIDTDVTINVSKDMALYSEAFFGQGEGYDINETLTLKAGALEFRKLSDSRLEYALSVDTSKIEDDDLSSIITFSWNSTGDIARIYYSDSAGYNSSFVFLQSATGEKKMIANGYFDDPSHNEGGVYIMEVRLIDVNTNTISERLSYKDFYHTTNYPLSGDNEVASKGDIGNSGGVVYIHPYTLNGTRFDAQGDTLSSGNNPTITTNDTDNGAQLKGTLSSTSSHRFVVVKEGETPNPYNILGYIFTSYEGDGYEYEYFGETKLLAEKNATVDLDKLDIYPLDEHNQASSSKISTLYFVE